MRMREPDPRLVIQNWGVLTAEVAPRVAPILLLIRSAAAAADPEMASLREEVDRERLTRMELNARTCMKANTCARRSASMKHGMYCGCKALRSCTSCWCCVRAGSPTLR